MMSKIEKGDRMYYEQCAAKECAWWDSGRECCGMLSDNAVTTDTALRKHLLWLDGRITDLEGEES